MIMVRHLLVAVLSLWIAADSALGSAAGQARRRAVSSGCDKPDCSQAGSCLGWAFG